MVLLDVIFTTLSAVKQGLHHEPRTDEENGFHEA